MLTQLESTVLGVQELRNMTQRDPVLFRAYAFTQHGWPTVVNDEKLKPYFSRCHELSAQSGYLLRGARAVIPEKKIKRKVVKFAK